MIENSDYVQEIMVVLGVIFLTSRKDHVIPLFTQANILQIHSFYTFRIEFDVSYYIDNKLGLFNILNVFASREDVILSCLLIFLRYNLILLSFSERNYQFLICIASYRYQQAQLLTKC